MKDNEKILSITHDGLDIFTHYFGDQCLRMSFSNPYREDSHPSCHLYLRYSSTGVHKYYLQDFGSSEWCGDCFHVVARIHHLDSNRDFKDILDIIVRDLNLNLLNQDENKTKAVAPYIFTPSLQSPSPIIKFTTTYAPFSKYDLSYWNKYGITEKVLDRYHVKSLRRCQFEREDGTGYEIRNQGFFSKTYGYMLNHEQGIKVYRPEAKMRFIYAGKIPRPYIFGLEQLPKEGEILYITGGEKDVLSLAAHGLCAIAFNSETAKISERFMEVLSKRFQHIVFLYDMDETGRRESAARVQEFQDRYSVTRLALPLKGSKTEKDISDFFALGHTWAELNKITLETIKI